MPYMRVLYKNLESVVIYRACFVSLLLVKILKYLYIDKRLVSYMVNHLISAAPIVAHVDFGVQYHGYRKYRRFVFYYIFCMYWTLWITRYS